MFKERGESSFSIGHMCVCVCATRPRSSGARVQFCGVCGAGARVPIYMHGTKADLWDQYRDDDDNDEGW